MDELGPAAADHVGIAGIKLHTPGRAARLLGGQERRAAAGEGVEYRFAAVWR